MLAPLIKRVVVVASRETQAAEYLADVDTSSIASDEFAAIILAAGLSSRMGTSNKLLLKHNGLSLLQHCVSAVKNSGIGEVLVVLGHDRANTETELAAMDVQHVFNEQYATGQMSSVQLGLQALSGHKKATLICLSDQPMIDATHLRKLMWAFENKPADKEIVIPTYQSKRGNPVVLSASVRERVLEQGGNPGCRQYIDKNPALVSRVSFNDAAFVFDIDTPDEYAALNDATSARNNKQTDHGTPL